MLRFAHSRDRCTHVRIRENEAKCHFGKAHSRGQDVLKLLDALDCWSEIVWTEVIGAPISQWERCVERELSAEAAFIERNPGDYPNVQFAAHWKQFIFRSLIEDVVDHLHRVNEPRPQRLQPVLRLPAVQAQSKCLNEPLVLKLLD